MDNPRCRRGKTWASVQRRAACTHLSLGRLYDPLKTEKCVYCKQPSSFGWLYCCTQDHNKFIPDPSMSVADHRATLQLPLSAQPAAKDLSLSVRNGIKNGLYNIEQIYILEAQKEELKDHIKSLEVQRGIMGEMEELEGYSDLADGNDNDDEGDQDESSSTSSDDSDSVVTGAPDRELEEDQTNNASFEEEGGSCEPPKPVTNSIFTTLKQPTKPLTPPCLFKCCLRCRPTFRERGYQSLNAIVNDPISHPPQWELDNRPISNANTIRNFHPGPPPWQLRHLYQTFDYDAETPTRWNTESQRSKSTDQPAPSSHSPETESLTKPDSGSKKRLSLRHTLRKALTILEPSSNLARPRSPSSSSSSASPPKTPRRTLTKRRRPSSTPVRTNSKTKTKSAPSSPSPSSPSNPQLERENRITNNPSLQDSLALMLAVNTPLPRGSEDETGLAGQGEVIVNQVRVEDGIAVTEEAVGEGEADIIIHV